MKKIMCCLFMLIICPPVFAAGTPTEKEMNDTVDVAAGFPLTIDDAGAQEYHTASMQFGSHFQHGGNGERSVSINPEIQYGLFRNVEVSATIPYTFERIEDSHNDNVSLSLKYNFVTEHGLVPDLAVQQDADFPTANGAAGTDLTTRFLLTKHILPQYGVTAVYLNANWTSFGHTDEDDRHNGFGGAIGFSHAVTDHTALVADLVQQQEEDRNKDDTLAEFGIRQFISKDLIISSGIGAGLNRNAPDVELNAGFEYGF